MLRPFKGAVECELLGQCCRWATGPTRSAKRRITAVQPLTATNVCLSLRATAGPDPEETVRCSGPPSAAQRYEPLGCVNWRGSERQLTESTVIQNDYPRTAARPAPTLNPSSASVGNAPVTCRYAVGGGRCLLIIWRDAREQSDNTGPRSLCTDRRLRTSLALTSSAWPPRQHLLQSRPIAYMH